MHCSPVRRRGRLLHCPQFNACTACECVQQTARLGLRTNYTESASFLCDDAAAASMGMTPDLILGALNKLSKNPLDEAIVRYVRACTAGYGKVKLVLARGKYLIESAYPELLRLLARHPSIRSARVWYDTDGRRLPVGTAPPRSGHERRGTDVGNASVSDDDDDDAGFIVSAGAAAETVGSLGIAAGAVEASGAAASGSGAPGAAGGDTSGGVLTSRYRGEVDSDDEAAAASAAAAAAVNASMTTRRRRHAVEVGTDDAASSKRAADAADSAAATAIAIANDAGALCDARRNRCDCVGVVTKRLPPTAPIEHYSEIDAT